MSKNHATSAMTKKDGGTKGGKDSHQDKQRQTTYAMAVQKQPLATGKQGTIAMKSGTKETDAAPVPTLNDGNAYKIVPLRKRKVRIEYHKQWIKLVSNIMAVYMVHDNGQNKVSCNVWNQWSMKGFTDPANDIHQLATVMDFPKHRFKNVKALGQHMLAKIPILKKYISIVPQSKDIAPICYIAKAKAVEVQKPERKATPAQSKVAEDTDKTKRDKEIYQPHDEIEKSEENKEVEVSPKIKSTINEPKDLTKEMIEIKDLTKELTPTRTNVSNREDNIIDKNPYASLVTEEESLQTLTSIDELHSLSTNDNDAMENDEDDDSVLKDLRSVEISYDKQYAEMRESINTNDSVDDIKTFQEEMISKHELDNIWDEKYKNMLSTHQNDRMNKSLIDDYWRKKEEALNDKMEKHLEIMNDMISSTVSNCETIHRNGEDKMEEKCNTIFTAM